MNTPTGLRPGAPVHVSFLDYATDTTRTAAPGSVWHVYTTGPIPDGQGGTHPAATWVEVYVHGDGIRTHAPADVAPCPRGCTEAHPARARRYTPARVKA